MNTPLPATVMAELLGIPPEHRPAPAGLHALLADLIADKRREPRNDLLCALVGVRDEHDGRLSEEELVGTGMMPIVAGHESTVNLRGNTVLALQRHPGQLALLRDRPS
ncbi:hypothetical protein ACWD00_06025 [Streptomyces viridiviolaceus]